MTALIQSVFGRADASQNTATLPSAVTPGNVVVAAPFTINVGDTWSTDPRQPGTCPPDTNMVQMARGVFVGKYHPADGATGLMAKVAGDSYSGPYGTAASCTSAWSSLALLEFEGVGTAGYDVAEQSTGTSSNVDLGTFTVGPDDVVVMAIMHRDGFDPGISPNGFTEIVDGAGFAMWHWVGYKIGDGDASVTMSSPDHWAAAAIHLTVSQAPTAAFTANPVEGFAPLVVQFTDESSGAEEWLWDFGDGTTSTEQNPVHTYTEAGVYNVSLTVTNGSGEDTATAPEFVTSFIEPVLPSLRERLLLMVRASFTDDKLYNHTLVVATGNKAQIHYGEASDTDPESPTRIEAIGDRVLKIETDLITTQKTAQKAAYKAFLDNCLISEDISVDAICNPALEGNDVIGIQETTFSQIEDTFRLNAFSIPLSTSRQSMRVQRVIDLQTQSVSVNDDIVLVGFEQTIVSTADTTASVDVHIDTQDGDFLVMWVALDGSGSLPITNPSVSGFTSISGSNKWKQRWADNEPASYTVNWTGTRRAIITLMTWRNVHPTSPVAGLSEKSNDPGKTFDIPKVTMSSGEYHLVAAAQSNGGGITYTFPASWTEFGEEDTGSGGASHVSVSLAHKPKVGSNAPSFDVTATENTGHTRYQLALRKDTT